MDTFNLFGVKLLIITLLPLLVRFAHQYWKTRARRSKRVIEIKGWPSVVSWFICYLVILVIAGLSLVQKDKIDTLIIIGWLILASAVIIRIMAIQALRDSYHEFIVTYTGQRLITTGIYSILRHPLHLGLLLEMVGLAIISHSIITLPLLVGSLLVLFGRTFNEEKHLIKIFGSRYRQYKRETWDITDLLPSPKAIR